MIYAASGNCHVYVDAVGRPRHGARDHRSTPRSSGRASATRPRRCSCTPTSRATFLPGARSRRCATRASSCAATQRVRADRRRGRRGDRRGLGDRVPGARARGAGRGLRRRGDRAHRTRTAPATPRRSSPARRAAARAFQLGVDAACVYVNASTRFTDGGQFGMGAEIGNSTQKLHARGPIGLRELCTFKYVVEGDGHVRALVRLGLLGGTFNPPHIGHLVCASQAVGRARARPRAARAGQRAAAQGDRGRSGRGAPRRAVPAGGGRRRAARRVARRRRGPRPVVHGRYPLQAA